MALTPDNDVPLAKHIQATRARDNIDRIEETLYGAGTSHRVNAIAVRQNCLLHLLSKELRVL